MKQRSNMIISALDENGMIVPAEEAVPGKTYYCAECGVKLHITHRNGKKFFICYANNPHTGKHCKRGRSKVRTPEDTNPDKLFAGMLSPDKERLPGQAKGGGYSVAHESHFDVTGFSSLSDFVEHGYHEHAPLKGMFGLYPMEQILIAKYSAHKIMNDNGSLGNRIVCVEKDAFLSDQSAIRFALCAGGVILQKKMFYLFFTPEQKEALCDLYYKLWKAPNSGKITHILIAGHWQSADLPDCKTVCGKECFGKWSCTGMQYTHFIKNAQIYVVYQQDDGKKKDEERNK